MTRRLRPMGDQAVLVDCGGDDPAGLAQGLRAAGPPGVLDVVPAAATVLVTVERPEALAEVSRLLVELPVAEVTDDDATVVLDVRYDGPDLSAVAQACGLEVDEVVAAHAGATYRVAFCGFSPGFAYLTGLDPRLERPRRADPRTRVPAGAVAIAGPYSAVYPRSTPGGWHLLGSCEAVLWDPRRERPGVLAPGTTVRFRPR